MPDEARSAAAIERQVGRRLARAKAGMGKADYVFIEGPNTGKTVDIMYAVRRDSIAQFNANFFRNFRNGNQLTKRLSSDFVAMDFENLTVENQDIVNIFLKKLDPKDL